MRSAGPWPVARRREIYAAADGSGLLRLTRDPGYDIAPAWSPDGSRIAFVGGGGTDVFVMNAAGSGRVRLATTPEGDLFPVWSPDGERVAFASFPEPGTGPALYMVGADGTGLRRLEVTPPGGPGPGFGPGCDHRPAWSPDGARLLFCHQDAGAPALFTISPDGTALTRLTDPSTRAGLAAWSPDGSRITFASSPAGPGGGGVYVMNADGSGVTLLAGLAADVNVAPAWSPDGHTILVAGLAFKSGTGNDVWAIDANRAGQTNLTQSHEPEFSPVWSPDGARIAFIRASADGNTDLYVMNADGSRQQRLPSTELLDGRPAWSPDGTKIAFETYSADEGSGE